MQCLYNLPEQERFCQFCSAACAERPAVKVITTTTTADPFIEELSKETKMDKEHYYGLSPEDCMDLYLEKHQAFLTEWERPLERKLDKMIRDRIKEIAGENQDGTGDYYSVILPFELPFPDGNTGEIKYWRFLDIEHGHCTLLASRIDEHENNVFCNVPYELDTLYALYRNLKRMGFWDEEWRHSFELE